MPPLGGAKADAEHDLCSAAVGHAPARKKTGFWLRSRSSSSS